MEPAPKSAASLAFGRFLVLPHRRELLADGQPLKLGGRAYDVLMTLRRRPKMNDSYQAALLNIS